MGVGEEVAVGAEDHPGAHAGVLPLLPQHRDHGGVYLVEHLPRGEDLEVPCGVQGEPGLAPHRVAGDGGLRQGLPAGVLPVVVEEVLRRGQVPPAGVRRGVPRQGPAVVPHVPDAQPQAHQRRQQGRPHKELGAPAALFPPLRRVDGAAPRGGAAVRAVEGVLRAVRRDGLRGAHARREVPRKAQHHLLRLFLRTVGEDDLFLLVHRLPPFLRLLAVPRPVFTAWNGAFDIH